MPTPDAPAPRWRSAYERPPRVAIVAGSTGLVGRALVRHLVRVGAYDRVVALVRRAGSIEADEVVAPVVVSYERLERTPLPFRDADVYCCLGTTMARVKSRAAFRRVDVTYVVRLAALAAAGGAAAFGLVSSLGADTGSAFFYNRCKGEAEKGVASVGLASVAIARPSLLLGERDEARRGERMAAAILGPLDGLLASPLLRPIGRLRPITADDVAAALAVVVSQRRPGVSLYDPTALRAAAGALLPTASADEAPGTQDEAPAPAKSPASDRSVADSTSQTDPSVAEPGSETPLDASAEAKGPSTDVDAESSVPQDGAEVDGPDSDRPVAS